MEILKIIGPSIIIIIGTVIGWVLKDKSEKLKLQKTKLIETQRENYIKILNPIIRTFTGIKKKGELDKAIKEVQSFDYKQTAFHLMFFGSDKVVDAYNGFFQLLYNNSENLNPKDMLSALGKLILEIRKDLGNKKTNLKELDMLRFLITDIDNIIEKN